MKSVGDVPKVVGTKSVPITDLGRVKHGDNFHVAKCTRTGNVADTENPK